MSLLAYGREDDQKENEEEEGLEKIKEAEKRELMRDVGHGDAISQNWREQPISLFCSFKQLTCASTGPLLHSEVKVARTAA